MNLVDIGSAIGGGEERITDQNYCNGLKRTMDVFSVLESGYDLESAKRTLAAVLRTDITDDNQRWLLDLVISAYYGTLIFDIPGKDIETMLRVTALTHFRDDTTRIFVSKKGYGKVEISMSRVNADSVEIKTVIVGGEMSVRLKYEVGIREMSLDWPMVAMTAKDNTEYIGGVELASLFKPSLYWDSVTNMPNSESTFFSQKDGTSYVLGLEANNELYAYIGLKGDSSVHMKKFKPGISIEAAKHVLEMFILSCLPTKLKGWEAKAISMPDVRRDMMWIKCVTSFGECGDTMVYTNTKALLDSLDFERVFDSWWNTNMVYLNPIRDSICFVLSGVGFETDIILMQSTAESLTSNKYDVRSTLEEYLVEYVRDNKMTGSVL